MVPAVRMAPHHHNLDLISVHAAAGSKVNGALDAWQKTKEFHCAGDFKLRAQGSSNGGALSLSPCVFYVSSLSLSLSIAAWFFEQELSSLEGSTRKGGLSGTYQLGRPKRSKVNGKAYVQRCRTRAVNPGAAPPRPKLGRGWRIFKGGS